MRSYCFRSLRWRYTWLLEQCRQKVCFHGSSEAAARAIAVSAVVFAVSLSWISYYMCESTAVMGPGPLGRPNLLSAPPPPVLTPSTRRYYALPGGASAGSAEDGGYGLDRIVTALPPKPYRAFPAEPYFWGYLWLVCLAILLLWFLDRRRRRRLGGSSPQWSPQFLLLYVCVVMRMPDFLGHTTLHYLRFVGTAHPRVRFAML